jgi:hypothetical protein
VLQQRPAGRREHVDSVCGSKWTKFVSVFSPSTGRNSSPGTISTGSTPATSTYRPGAVGVPPASVLKWALLIGISFGVRVGQPSR